MNTLLGRMTRHPAGICIVLRGTMLLFLVNGELPPPTGSQSVNLPSMSSVILSVVVIPLLSVTHGQWEARPTVTFPAYAGTKFILLGDIISRPARMSIPVGTADQARKYVLNLAVAHATAMVSKLMYTTGDYVYLYVDA